MKRILLFVALATGATTYSHWIEELYNGDFEAFSHRLKEKSINDFHELIPNNSPLRQPDSRDDYLRAHDIRTDNYQYSPLAIGLFMSNRELLNFLLQHGLDVNSLAESAYGIPPITLAANKKQFESFLWLYEHGFDAARYSNGRTSIIPNPNGGRSFSFDFGRVSSDVVRACSMNSQEGFYRSQGDACRFVILGGEGRVHIRVFDLAPAQLDEHTTDWALRLAAGQGITDRVKELLASDCSFTQEALAHAFENAAYAGHQQILISLIEYVQFLFDDDDVMKDMLSNALMYAAAARRADICTFLINQGAPVDDALRLTRENTGNRHSDIIVRRYRAILKLLERSESQGDAKSRKRTERKADKGKEREIEKVSDNQATPAVLPSNRRKASDKEVSGSTSQEELAQIPGENGVIPLVAAIEEGSETIDYFLSLEPNVLTQYHDGNTLFHLLISHASKMTLRIDTYFKKIYHLASRQTHDFFLFFNAQNEQGLTPLMLLLDGNYFWHAMRVVAFGGDFSISDNNGVRAEDRLRKLSTEQLREVYGIINTMLGEYGSRCNAYTITEDSEEGRRLCRARGLIQALLEERDPRVIECTICLEELSVENASAVECLYQCGHVVHHHCAEQLRESRHSTCPTCQAEMITKASLS